MIRIGAPCPDAAAAGGILSIWGWWYCGCSCKVDLGLLPVRIQHPAYIVGRMIAFSSLIIMYSKSNHIVETLLLIPILWIPSCFGWVFGVMLVFGTNCLEYSNALCTRFDLYPPDYRVNEPFLILGGYTSVDGPPPDETFRCTMPSKV